MLRNLHNLDGGIITGLDRGVCRQRHLGDADCARVGIRRGTDDLDGRHHRVAHVRRTAARAVGAETQVDVDEGGLVALEPARLKCNRAAQGGPIGPICGDGVAAAWVEIISLVVALRLLLFLDGRAFRGEGARW